uniref:Peptidase M60 domain-containing protein n=1 Tax=Macrostomum lignano TaxID=282301 RepID=A0A1I8I8D3_9PLAT
AAAAADVESSPESLWLDELRTTRAPMFELRVPGQLVIAAPTEIGRRRLMLQGPAGLVRLARLWLKIMIAINEFHGVCSGGEERPREERIVLDKAISTGSMHSGYPIMGYLDYDECLLSVDKVLNKGSWGPIHELCHNHQWRLSEFSGTVEASNNLPNVFVHDTILRVSRSCHPSLAPESRQSQRQAYIAAGKRFDADWNVWVALDTFLQLQETFGWEPFKALNRTYRTEEALTHLADGSDQSRIDAYLKLLSVQVSLNLTPFFLAWGFPISEAVQAELSSLPEWRDHPMSG